MMAAMAALGTTLGAAIGSKIGIATMGTAFAGTKPLAAIGGLFGALLARAI